jgi:hypothetical protein
LRYRVEKFSDLDGIFARIRLHHAPDFCHEMVRKVDEKNTGKNCALCSNGNKKRTSMFWCNICEVHLCTTVIPGIANSRQKKGTGTCHQEWHVSTDLKREAFFRNIQVTALQVDKKTSRKSESETQDASTGAASAPAVATGAAPVPTDSATGSAAATPGGVPDLALPAVVAPARKTAGSVTGSAADNPVGILALSPPHAVAPARNILKTQPIQLVRENSNELRAEMDLVKSQSLWPMRYRVEKFSELDELCARVRLHEAPDFHHEMVRKADENGIGKNCVLCSAGNKKRTSLYWCRICEVHLCTTAITGTVNSRDKSVTDTCHQRWHVSTDLKREARFRNIQVTALQVDKKASRKRLNEEPEIDYTTYTAPAAAVAAAEADGVPGLSPPPDVALARNISVQIDLEKKDVPVTVKNKNGHVMTWIRVPNSSSLETCKKQHQRSNFIPNLLHAIADKDKEEEAAFWLFMSMAKKHSKGFERAAKCLGYTHLGYIPSARRTTGSLPTAAAATATSATTPSTTSASGHTDAAAAANVATPSTGKKRKARP